MFLPIGELKQVNVLATRYTAPSAIPLLSLMPPESLAAGDMTGWPARHMPLGSLKPAGIRAGE